jgi:type VI secretion system protein ImpF
MDDDDDFEPRLPCLFDRLIDEKPDSLEDSGNRRTASFEDYRAGVLRDLRWLMNASRHPTRDEAESRVAFNPNGKNEDIYKYPHVSGSVLNFGIRDIGGITISSLEEDDQVLHRIEESIRLFEPRIDPDTVQVKMVWDEELGTLGKMAFEISGDLWALPHTERITFRTEMDLEAGTCDIKSIR